MYELSGPREVKCRTILKFSVPIMKNDIRTSPSLKTQAKGKHTMVLSTSFLLRRAARNVKHAVLLLHR